MADSILTKARNLLMVTIADAAAFRTWTGAADRTQALNRIYKREVPALRAGAEYTREELERIRPFVEVWDEDEEGYDSRPIAHQTRLHSGVFIAQFEQEIPSHLLESPEKALDEFVNTVMLIKDQMEVLPDAANGHEYLTFGPITKIGEDRTDTERPSDMGQFMQCGLSFAWPRHGE